MRKVYLLGIMLGIAITGFCQKNGSIKGIAFDSTAKQAVAAATITILEKKDSSLVSFTMTDNNGNFELRGIPPGEYRLLITHVNYHGSNSFFSINETAKEVNLGQITMHDLATVLSEVVVSNEAPPVTMVGDTIQYNAGSFRVAPNANVEQLLKKLPGVTVDKDGTIKAQGEKATRVLVDGKEFFGTDPKIATRNLPADAVDKVQVFDKQSEQAQLTGFEDGNYEKTINLKLKKDKKKGVFGKVMAGVGDKERYEGRFNVNSFKGARQLSAIGMGNNTNAEGFSFMDILNFSGAMNQMRQGGGGGTMVFGMSGDEASALGMNNNNAGINTSWAGGVNYNNIVGNKLDFQSNYFYNRYNPNIKSRIFRQNFFQNSTNLYDENSYSDNLNNGHRLNFNTLYQIDSFHSLRITPSMGFQRSRNISKADYRTRRENSEMINEGFSNTNTNNEGFNFRNDIIFRKKFRRKGRTLSFSLNTSVNESTGDGSLESIINFYNGGNISDRDTLNQINENSNDIYGYNARVVYTEPLWKRSLLELSAGKSNMKSRSEKITYDYNRSNGKHDVINELLTNDFENKYGYTNAGIRIRKQAKKMNYSLGLTWQRADLEGKIISGVKDSIITKQFNNLLPNASFQYNFTRFKSFTLNYNTITNQPTMTQLQPVPDNTNPLYIREGNPDLQQEFTHTLRGNLNLISPYSNKNLFFFFSGIMTSNKIVNFDEVDLSTGVRKTRPVNVDGIYNLNSSLSYSLPITSIKSTIEISTAFGYSKGKQFINNVENTIRNISLGPVLRFDINATDKISLGLRSEFRVNHTKYSLQSAQNTKYLSQEYSSSVDWQLPYNFFLGTEFTYTINSLRADGFNTNVPMWNATFSKQFLKYNRGELRISATDILNRNTGISRNTTQNYIEDREVNILRRFFLLSFTYSLSKSGLNNAPGTMRIISR